MNSYSTSQIARNVGVHPNTVRLYEQLGLIPKAERKKNGYRVFTDFHLEQFKLARTAFRVEVLQNGLRKKAIEIIKASAARDFDRAIRLTESYLKQIEDERKNAEEAITAANQLLCGDWNENASTLLTRKEAADSLHLSINVLRNWEMNGLLSVKRKRNGYRVYSIGDMRWLKMIRSLRCANYSLAAILRMLNALSGAPGINIREAIDTPGENEDVISVCDRLLTSLQNASANALAMLIQLKKMKNINP